jgi:uncharacterized membrane protein YgdD (TMEM256/DUF423 family)
VSVIVGAFAAHGLPATDVGNHARELLQTGSHYEIVHALAMLATVALAATGKLNPRLSTAALWLFLMGSVVFPGSLYALAFDAPRWMGAVAPIGGLGFILGWLALAGAALRRN